MADDQQRSVLTLAERLPLQSPKPFSTPGFSALEQEIEAYINDLIDEAAKLARRYRADDVSAMHVVQAAQNLTASAKHRVYRHLGTIGGIILGAGLSSVLTITTAPPPIPLLGFLISI